MLANPCAATIGGLRVGASSVDVVFHIMQEQFVKLLPHVAAAGARSDPFANASRHILEQRRCVPGRRCDNLSRHAGGLRDSRP